MVLLPRFAASRSLNLRHIKSFQTVSEEEFSETRTVKEEPGLYHAVQTCLVLFPPRSAQESRYASPSFVIEYTRHPGPPSSGVSHSVLQSPSCSICLSVRYNVPGIFSSNPSSTRCFISSYPRELSSCSVTSATGTSATGLSGTGTSATGRKLFVGRISTSLIRSPLSHTAPPRGRQRNASFGVVALQSHVVALRTPCLLFRGVLGPRSTPFPSVRQPGYLLKKRRPVALRPRLTTGLPLSQRAPLPLKEMHPRMCRTSIT